MRLLRRYKISQRIWLIIALSLIGITSITISSLVISHQALLDEKFAQTQHSVEAAHSIIEDYYQRFSNGKMDEAVAKSTVLSVIEAMRYDETNYFWVNDSHPKMVMHPIKPELNGKDISEVKDPDGKYLFIDMINVVKAQGAGHVPYMWEKPGLDNPARKISYVKGFEPWGWIIGSGIYIDDVEEVFWKNAWVSTVIAAIILAILAVLSYLIISSITKPICLTASALMDIARGEGDLSQRLNDEGRDEISALSGAFNEFTGKIQKTMSNVEEVAKRLNLASTELSSVTLQSSEGMDQQYNETHQVAVAVTELSSTVEEISRSADGAAESATDANKEARGGMTVMQQTTDEINVLLVEVNKAGEVINQLEQESIKIGSVLDVIRGIAEQTNLLALNAAIEAARAGEQGRGFAVVADEVRTLASRTQESTQEIQEMIERLQAGSRKAVEVMNSGSSTAQSTVETAKKASKSLKFIVEAVESISQMNSHIASASEEQTTAVKEIDQSINKISTLADQSNEGSNRVVSATQDLHQLGSQLNDLLATFKIR